MEQVEISQRLNLSRLLALIGLLLLLGSYFGGTLFEYRDPVTGELEFDEENLAFQPYPFLIEMDEAEEIDTAPELVEHLGETLYAYFPSGWWSYLIGYQTMPCLAGFSGSTKLS